MNKPMPAHRVCFREVLAWANRLREEGVPLTMDHVRALLNELTKAVEADRERQGSGA